LGFGFVSAQLQAAAGMLLCQSLAKTQKSSLKTATLFLKTLQGMCADRQIIADGQLMALNRPPQEKLPGKVF